jgi:hypothetical protein
LSIIDITFDNLNAGNKSNVLIGVPDILIGYVVPLPYDQTLLDVIKGYIISALAAVALTLSYTIASL